MVRNPNQRYGLLNLIILQYKYSSKRFFENNECYIDMAVVVGTIQEM